MGILLPFKAVIGEVKIKAQICIVAISGVIGLFCRQYDIIKDNDSNNNPKEKGKGPEQSPQGRPVVTRQVMWGPVGVERVIFAPQEHPGKGEGQRGG